MENSITIHFFGAGLGSPHNCGFLTQVIQEELCQEQVHIHSDLLAAAYATLGHDAGVVAILGTGSVAFRYDGSQVRQRHGGWGVLLGDEGGGAALGRAWLRLYLDKCLPVGLAQMYAQFLGLDSRQIVERVHHQMPLGSFLAQQTQFLAAHQHEPEVMKCLKEQFALFLANTLIPCVHHAGEEIVFMGGVARNFFAVISQLCRRQGWDVRLFSESPIHSLFIHLQQKVRE